MNLTRRGWVMTAACLCAAKVVSRGYAADLQSGVQVGDFAAPFDVKDITGPNKGKTLCYR
jgi:hypothetical protein